MEEIEAQGRDIVKAIPGSKSQFQMLYPVQVYPDFMAHLIDCMINPMDIVKDSTNIVSNAVSSQFGASNPISNG